MLVILQRVLSKDRLDLASGIVCVLIVLYVGLQITGTGIHWSSSEVDWRSPLPAAVGALQGLATLIVAWAIQMSLFHGVMYWRWRYHHSPLLIRVAVLAIAVAFPLGPLALYLVAYRRNREYDDAVRAVRFPWMAEHRAPSLLIHD